MTMPLEAGREGGQRAHMHVYKYIHISSMNTVFECMNIVIYVYMYTCIYVYMHVSTCVYLYLSIFVYLCIYRSICPYLII